MVEAEPPVVDDDFCQRRNVAQPEIEALAGDRMDRMRRVADERETRADIAFGMQHPQRIAPAVAQHPQGAVPVAEPALHLAAERRV